MTQPSFHEMLFGWFYFSIVACDLCFFLLFQMKESSRQISLFGFRRFDCGNQNILECLNCTLKSDNTNSYYLKKFNSSLNCVSTHIVVQWMSSYFVCKRCTIERSMLIQISYLCWISDIVKHIFKWNATKNRSMKIQLSNINNGYNILFPEFEIVWIWSSCVLDWIRW